VAVAWRHSTLFLDGLPVEAQILRGDSARRAFHLSVDGQVLPCRLHPFPPALIDTHVAPPFLTFVSDSPVHVEWCKYGPLVCEPWWFVGSYSGYYLSIVEVYEII
jgi:hypothetical protein